MYLFISFFGRGTTTSSWSFSNLPLLFPRSKTIQGISRANKAPCRKAAIHTGHIAKAPSITLNRQAGTEKINSCDKEVKNVPTWVFNSLTDTLQSLINTA